MKHVVSEYLEYCKDNMYFFDVLNEDDKRIYETAQEIFGIWLTVYKNLVNFDLLYFNLIEITEEEYKTLQKCHISGNTIYSVFLDELCDAINEKNLGEGNQDYLEWMYNMTDDELKEFFRRINE